LIQYTFVVLLDTLNILHFVGETTNSWASDLNVQVLMSCIAGRSVRSK